MLIFDYFEEIKLAINRSKIIIDEQINLREFDVNEGMVYGRILFVGGYLLEFMEYVVMDKPRPKYRFHFQDQKGKLIFRYDNSSHFRDVPSFPHHKHLGMGKVVDSKEIGLIEVMKEIERFVLKSE